MPDISSAAAKFHTPHTVNIRQYDYRLCWCLALGIFCRGHTCLLLVKNIGLVFGYRDFLTIAVKGLKKTSCSE